MLRRFDDLYLSNCLDLIGAFDSREFLESNDLTILMLVDLYGVLTLTKARRTSRRNEKMDSGAQLRREIQR